jgi:geranylgeranyl reductase family protein
VFEVVSVCVKMAAEGGACVFALLSSHPCISAFVLVVVFYCVYRFLTKPPKRRVSDYTRKFGPIDKALSDVYEVAIVGAGPAGATCGYFLGKAGRKTLLLEKKKFPREKYCGDAVCKTAIEILDEMGIYQQLLDENKAKIADNGGMVSPGGLSYIGRSKELLGRIPAAIAVKRTHLDEAIAMTAKKAGADLKEECSVEKADLDKSTGLWTLTLQDGKTFQARVLVCADGATSKLATTLGIVTTPPSSQCSRAYVEGGTHKFKADGVVFWNRDILPGYAALFKHPNDELNYCCYLIPGNPKVVPEDLSHWHDRLLKEDPFISKALGDNFKIERMRAASLRLGGVPRSSDNHVILIGDAAGMIDPMTGEGIHHAMESGKMAAGFLGECLDGGNFSDEVMSIWHELWMDKFGSDYKWSMWICQLTYRFPILLDAATAAVCRKGDKFLARWADIMTGRVPKIHLLRPEFVIVITYELVLQIVKRLIGRGPSPSKSAKLE